LDHGRERVLVLRALTQSRNDFCFPLSFTTGAGNYYPMGLFTVLFNMAVTNCCMAMAEKGWLPGGKKVYPFCPSRELV